MLKMPRLLTVVALAAILLVPSPAPADSGLQSGDFHIVTDETNYNLTNGDFTMPHHVSASRPGTQISGDRARGNSRRHLMTISGNVAVHQTGPISGSMAAAEHLSNAPSTMTADSLTVDWGNRVYTAEGRVRFTQGARVVSADRGTLDDASHQMTLTGNVHIEEGPQTMDAQNMDYNTQTEDVKAHGNVTIRAPADQGYVPPAKPKKGR
jgi:lipopolysaccharide export system protein LptA